MKLLLTLFDFQVVHSVHGIMFKDLKQILRKEQCDASILLTANVPAAKKIIVHGPREYSSWSDKLNCSLCTQKYGLLLLIFSGQRRLYTISVPCSRRHGVCTDIERVA